MQESYPHHQKILFWNQHVIQLAKTLINTRQKIISMKNRRMIFFQNFPVACRLFFFKYIFLQKIFLFFIFPNLKIFFNEKICKNHQSQKNQRRLFPKKIQQNFSKILMHLFVIFKALLRQKTPFLSS